MLVESSHTLTRFRQPNPVSGKAGSFLHILLSFGSFPTFGLKEGRFLLVRHPSRSHCRILLNYALRNSCSVMKSKLIVAPTPRCGYYPLCIKPSCHQIRLNLNFDCLQGILKNPESEQFLKNLESEDSRIRRILKNPGSGES